MLGIDRVPRLHTQLYPDIFEHRVVFLCIEPMVLYILGMPYFPAICLTLLPKL